MSGIIGNCGLLMASGQWNSAYQWTPDGTATGWSGYTVRQRIEASQLIAGSKLRITVNNLTNALAMSVCYVQTAASNSAGVYAFSGTPAQVRFGGNASLSLPSGGSRISDYIDLPIDASTALVISCYVTSNNLARRTVLADFSSYYIAGNDAATVSATGYATPAHNAYIFTQLQVRQP